MSRTCRAAFAGGAQAHLEYSQEGHFLKYRRVMLNVGGGVAERREAVCDEVVAVLGDGAVLEDDGGVTERREAVCNDGGHEEQYQDREGRIPVAVLCGKVVEACSHVEGREVLEVLQKFDDAMFSSDNSVRGEMSRAGSNRWSHEDCWHLWSLED